MISKLNDQSSGNFTSFVGRTTLAAGLGYATYRTFKGERLPSSIRTAGKKTAFVERLTQTLKTPTPKFTATAKGIQLSETADVLGGQIGKFITGKSSTKMESTAEGVIHALRKSGKNDSFIKDFQGFLDTVQGQFKYKRVGFSMLHTNGGNLLEVGITPRGSGQTFKIRPVSQAGEVFLGNNQPTRYTSRKVLDRSGSTPELLGIDQAILREQTKQLANIIPVNEGEANKNFIPKMTAREIERTGTESSIFEDYTKGGSRPLENASFISNPVSAMRNEEVLVDPFKKLYSYPDKLDASHSVLSQMIAQGHLLPGSPSMTAAGIGVTPNSLLAQFPGGTIAPAGKQYFRTSELTAGGASPKVRFPVNIDVNDPFKTFNLGVVNPEDITRVQAKASERIGEIESTLRGSKINKTQRKMLFSERRELKGLMFGELAEEEMIMSHTLNPRARNQMYQFNVDVNKTSSEFENQIGSIAEQLGLVKGGDYTAGKAELAKLMEQDGGIAELMAQRGVKPKISGMTLGLGTSEISGQHLPVTVGNAKGIEHYITNMVAKDKETLTVSTASEFDAGLFQKWFGTFKGTTKTKQDIPFLLGQIKSLNSRDKKLASRAQLASEGLLDFYKGIDFLVPKHPFEKLLTEGRFDPKEVPAEFSSVLLGAAEQGGEFNEGLLRNLGYKLGRKSGQWRNTGEVLGTQILERAKGFAAEHKMSVPDVFTRVLGTGRDDVVHRIKGILSPDIHISQSGVGNLGSLSERAMHNIISMYPESVSSNLQSRLLNGLSQTQYQSLLGHRSIVGDTKAEGMSVKGLFSSLQANESSLEDLFSTNLNRRREVIGALTGGKDKLTVNLGRDAGKGVHNVVVSADQDLTPFIGKRIGGKGLTNIDQDSHNLIQEAFNSGSSELLAHHASRYKTGLNQAIDTAMSNINKGQFTGSMYARAQSELPGMRAFAEGLGSTASGVLTPVVAMHEKDIARSAGRLIEDHQLNQEDLGRIRKEAQAAQEHEMLNAFFGKENVAAASADYLEHSVREMKGRVAIDKARRGELWGLVTREPVEGLHRTIPVPIASAEAMGAQTYQRGAAYFSGGPLEAEQKGWAGMRKALGLDFDADTTSIIPFGDTTNTTHMQQMWKGGDSAMGKVGEEFQRTMKFFDVYNIKGKSNIDVMKMGSGELTQALLEMHRTEKKLIGPTSNAFKDIHMGFRQLLAENMSGENLTKAFRGEATALLAIESGLKAKHRSLESLRSGESFLDVFNSNKTTEGKIGDFQSFFDKLSFQAKDADLGEQIRKNGENVHARVQGALGLKTEEEAKQFTRTYGELTGTENITNIFTAQAKGKILNRTKAFESAVAGGMTEAETVGTGARLMAQEFKPLGMKFLKNVGKYAILPAAAIGIASSLLGSTPNELPVEMSVKTHDASSAPPVETVPIERKVWAMTKKEKFRVSGNVDTMPNPSQYSSYFNGASTNLSVSDYRSHMTQEYINKKVKRGL